jgi:hypothetical protein
LRIECEVDEHHPVLLGEAARERDGGKRRAHLRRSPTVMRAFDPLLPARAPRPRRAAHAGLCRARFVNGVEVVKTG